MPNTEQGPQPIPISYKRADGWLRSGRVIAASASMVTIAVPGVRVGDIVAIDNSIQTLAEVRSVEEGICKCALLDGGAEIAAGTRAYCEGGVLGCYIGSALLGQVVDAWGRWRMT